MFLRSVLLAALAAPCAIIFSVSAMAAPPTTGAVPCLALGPQSSASTPVELYQSLTACINEGDYDAAIDLFGLAGSYGRFDALRVADASAHQIVGILRSNALASALPANRADFQKLAGAVYDDQRRHAMLCKRVAAIGPPSYVPTYMRVHGLDAIVGADSSKRQMSAAFDQNAAWGQALADYLNCK